MERKEKKSKEEWNTTQGEKRNEINTRQSKGEGRKGKERKGKERKGKERKGKEIKEGKGREGKERKRNETKRNETKRNERKGKETKTFYIRTGARGIFHITVALIPPGFLAVRM